jgi:hypothetical protein
VAAAERTDEELEDVVTELVVVFGTANVLPENSTETCSWTLRTAEGSPVTLVESESEISARLFNMGVNRAMFEDAPVVTKLVGEAEIGEPLPIPVTAGPCFLETGAAAGCITHIPLPIK